MPIPKYAILENERRFLVLDPPDLAATPSRLIEDVYLIGSRLRLRTVTHPDGAREFKFCKKYGSANPASGPITNIYLTAGEHAILAALPGLPLRKRRFRVDWQGKTFGLDVFDGPLAGLHLCEKEAESADAIRRVDFPSWATREVTDDLFFTGGNLVQVTAGELKSRLKAERATRPPSEP